MTIFNILKPKTISLILLFAGSSLSACQTQKDATVTDIKVTSSNKELNEELTQLSNIPIEELQIIIETINAKFNKNNSELNVCDPIKEEAFIKLVNNKGLSVTISPKCLSWWDAYCSYHGPIGTHTNLVRLMERVLRHRQQVKPPHAIRYFEDSP